MEQPIVSPAVPEKEKVDMLAPVREQMDVYDSLGKWVGKVDGLHSGAGDRQPTGPALQPVPVSTPNAMPVPLVVPVDRPEGQAQDLGDTLGANDDFPREIRARLEHDGFIRIDPGFFRHHRYALRGQIERVEGERVMLNVPASDLLKH